MRSRDEEKREKAERKKAFDKLSSDEMRLVEDNHPRKIQKRKAEEEAKFDVDTFARDVDTFESSRRK